MSLEVGWIVMDHTTLGGENHAFHSAAVGIFCENTFLAVDT
jgi:hypothetical protein